MFNPHVSDLLSSFEDIHLTLSIASDRLLTRFDNEFVINLALSINCNM